GTAVILRLCAKLAMNRTAYTTDTAGRGMAKIRKIEIQHFRCIQSLRWLPAEGISCLIGPGDSGKSTVLDAIDLCLGARRSAQLSDADFFNLDATKPISI